MNTGATGALATSADNHSGGRQEKVKKTVRIHRKG